MKYTFTLLAFALSVTIPASAATDYFISTPFTGTITNNLKTPGCSSSTINIPTKSGAVIPDEISSFTFGGTDPVSATGVSGKLSLQNFVILKSFDSCSGDLVTAFLTGELMPTVTIYATKSADSTGAPTNTPYLTIVLTNVIISQYTLSGVPGGEKPSEQISLAFAKATVTATNSSSGGTTTLNYDGSLNQLTR